MVSNLVRLPPALLFLKNTRGRESYPCRMKVYLVLIFLFKSCQTCLHKGRLEAKLCLSRATAFCTPHKQWNVCDCDCHCLLLHCLLIHLIIKSKVDLSRWSTAAVKGQWQNPYWLKWGKESQVLFFSKPSMVLLQPVSETSSCIFASWIAHLFLSLVLFPVPILTLLLYHLTPVGYGVCGKEAAYYKKYVGWSTYSSKGFIAQDTQKP